MQLTSYKTKQIVPGDNLLEVLKTSLPKLENGNVVAITSKVVSICEENVVKDDGKTDKKDLVIKEAERYIQDKHLYEEHKTILTIAHNILTPSAGIDISNGNGYFILWPKDPMKTAENVWQFLRKEHNVSQLGVIIIDSTFWPLRTGSVSVGLSWCGFEPVKNYIGTPDVFGQPLQYTTTSFVDGLAVAAGIVMGEGNQQTPLAVIKDIPDMKFVDRAPTQEEITLMHYPLEKDTFGPLLTAATWEKGGKSK